MSWVLVRGGTRMELDEPDAATLHELLLPREVEQIEAGALVAELGGAVLRLDSPLPPSGEILLRSPQPTRDQAAFLYRVNGDGARVRIGELLAIRAFEEATGQEVWGQSLQSIRDDVADWQAAHAVQPGFFRSVAASNAARAALFVGPGRGARRHLRELGRAR